MFFEPLNSDFVLTPVTHSPITKGRQAFLCRTISAIVLSLPDDLPVSQVKIFFFLMMRCFRTLKVLNRIKFLYQKKI